MIRQCDGPISRRICHRQRGFGCVIRGAFKYQAAGGANQDLTCDRAACFRQFFVVQLLNCCLDVGGCNVAVRREADVQCDHCSDRVRHVQLDVAGSVAQQQVGWLQRYGWCRTGACTGSADHHVVAVVSSSSGRKRRTTDETSGGAIGGNRIQQVGAGVVSASQDNFTGADADRLEDVAVPEIQLAVQRVKEELTDVVSYRLGFTKFGNGVVGELGAGDGAIANPCSIQRAGG